MAISDDIPERANGDTIVAGWFNTIRTRLSALVAADITDFDTEVSNNTSVTTNTAKVSADGSIDTHSDVDTTTSAPNTGEHLEWDGSNWVPAAAATVDWTYVDKATTYTAVVNDFIDADSSGGAFTITLPTAASISGKRIAIRKTDSGNNGITIDGNGSETIDGSTTIIIYGQYHAVYLVSDGTNWMIASESTAFDTQTAASSTKTPAGASHYHQHTGNSITLEPGRHRLLASKAKFARSGTATFYVVRALWMGANGADSGTIPTTLSAVTGLTIVSGTDGEQKFEINSGMDSLTLTTNEVIVECTQAATVYLNTFSDQGTAANARVTVYPSTERLR